MARPLQVLLMSPGGRLAPAPAEIPGPGPSRVLRRRLLKSGLSLARQITPSTPTRSHLKFLRALRTRRTVPGKYVCFAVSRCGHARPQHTQSRPVAPGTAARPCKGPRGCSGMTASFLLTLSLLHLLKASGEFSPDCELQTWPQYSPFTAKKESPPLLT